jgi:isopenicillin-N epimerase
VILFAVQTKRPLPSLLRSHWALDPELVFLNHGSFGACPKHILALQSALREEMEASPVQFLWRRYESRLQPAREALAGFIGANSSDLVFVTNTTVAVNAVVRSWKLELGDEILTTNLDYNACRNVLNEIAAASGAGVVVAEIPFPIMDEEQAVAAILEKITSRTRYAMIDHVTSASALVLPVKRIVRELESRGVEVLVDGAHAPGMLPLDVEELNASWYCGSVRLRAVRSYGRDMTNKIGSCQRSSVMETILRAVDSLRSRIGSTGREPLIRLHGSACPRRFGG